jgi:hypothetical protein
MIMIAAAAAVMGVVRLALWLPAPAFRVWELFPLALVLGTLEVALIRAYFRFLQRRTNTRSMNGGRPKRGG